MRWVELFISLLVFLIGNAVFVLGVIHVYERQQQRASSVLPVTIDKTLSRQYRPVFGRLHGSYVRGEDANSDEIYGVMWVKRDQEGK